MNEEEEAALVDSYFLPGGILDPDVDDEQQDDTEGRSAHVPFSFQWSGAPLQNPWANVSRHWDERAEPPALAMVGKRPESAIGESDADGLIGSSSYEPTRISAGPLHKSDTLIRFASNYRATPQNPELLYPDWNVHSHSTEPYGRNNVDATPFRAPPGLDQSIPTEVGVKAVNGQNYHEEDSMRSESSVPHDLFEYDSDRDSSASSLSDSSIDELSSPHGTLHRDESTENQSENDTTQNEDRNERWEGNVKGEDQKTKEGYIEADENVVTDLDTAPTEPPAARKSKEDYREIDEKVVTSVRTKSPMAAVILPVSVESTTETSNIDSATPPCIPTPTKLHNRQRDKAQPTETAASPSKSTVCASQSFYQTCGRSSLEWIHTSVQRLLRYLLTSLRTGAWAIVAFYRFTIPFWMRLIRMLRQMLFTILRTMGTLISISVLVCKSAFLEAVQETRVSLCYAILYFTPICLSALMTYFALPHFTPHLVSCAVLYGLCHTVKRENEMTQQLQGVENAGSGGNEPMLSKEDKARVTSSNNETNARQACQTILRYTRFNLPIMFFLEGFSNELGAVMSLSGSGRLISAYILTILRKNLLFSPIAWLSSALQLLIASYLHWIPRIDLLILVVGLASVRFSQFLKNRVATNTLKAKGS